MTGVIRDCFVSSRTGDPVPSVIFNHSVIPAKAGIHLLLL